MVQFSPERGGQWCSQDFRIFGKGVLDHMCKILMGEVKVQIVIASKLAQEIFDKIHF